MAAATEESLRRNLADMLLAVESQGSSVRALEASKAPKTEIDAAVEALNQLKVEKSSIERELQSIVSGNGADSSVTREAFRQAVVSTLLRLSFYFPNYNFEKDGYNYGHIYGPPGVAVYSNVESFWRKHFILEQDIIEVDYSCVEGEDVLIAPGDVDKFTDLVVKDEKTRACYLADHLLVDFCKDKLEKDLSISAKMAAELKRIVANSGDFSAEELGEKIKEYGIIAPDTKNLLSDPFQLNLMFKTTKVVPAGLTPGMVHSDAVNFIYADFKKGHKLPFAVARTGLTFRNEISPHEGLLRIRESTLAHINHFVDPEDKSNQNYSEVVNLEFMMFPREEQMSGQFARNIPLGEAVSKGIVKNQTLGYFIGRVYLFLTRLGIDKKRLRFRQHLANETAVCASDRWDAEIESSFGWIECVGIVERSSCDLKVLMDKIGVDLVARVRFSEPREVEKLVIVPVKKELGPVFKGNHKHVVEALEAMNEREAMDMKAKLESKGEVEFYVNTLGKNVCIKKNMLSISKEKKKEHHRVFTPLVIESSLHMCRIIYCLYEHSFYTRPSEAGDEQLNVFRFLPLVAPIQCVVLPLVQNQEYEDVAKVISKSLTVKRILNSSKRIVNTGTSIGEWYARADELGVPLAITVDSISSVTIRERDSKDQIRVKVDEAASVVNAVTYGHRTWEDIRSSHCTMV